MENNENLNKIQTSKTDLNNKKARELKDEIGELEAKFKSIAYQNVMALTSAYTNNFRNVNPEVLTKQLEILKERSDKLHELAMDYALKCGKEYETPFYKTAVVTGTLARARLIMILEDMEVE